MHPIFTLIVCNNLVEVIALIQSDPGAVREKAPRERGRSSPLHCASALGHVEICRYLLDHGAEVDSRDSLSRTPLHLSCQIGHVLVTRLLLSRGAQIDTQDNEGMNTKFNPKLPQYENQLDCYHPWITYKNICHLVLILAA